MQKVSLILSAALLSAILSSFSFERSEQNSVAIKSSTDRKVKIGKQVWMIDNLNVDKFRNGDPILHAQSAEEWINAGKNKQPAWCYHTNDSVNGEKYGKLYNWYAVIDPRGLAPKGWHVPSDSEWTALVQYLGGWWSAAYKMKSSSGWKDMGNGSNSSGFSGLPGGCRSSYDGHFNSIGEYGYWWSSTECNTVSAWTRHLFSAVNSVFRYNLGKEDGYSVRCLRD